MQYNSIYIYGIVDGRIKENLDVRGIGTRDNEVFNIPYKDVTAIVSNTPFEEYDPNEENTLAHERVIQAVLSRNLTIAPMRFCTIVGSRDDAIKLLNSGYFAFKRNLLRIKNKVELDIKAFLEIEKLKEEVGEGNELIEKSKEMAAQLNEIIKNLSEEDVLEEQITEDMILNSSILIYKQKVKELYDKIGEFDKKFTNQLKIRISGPTAPYNFVNMPTR
jgi:hypothetical protein